MEKNPWTPFPQFQHTERPDKAASGLLEGRIVLVVDNSPGVLLLPVTYGMFFQAGDDYYSRFEVASETINNESPMEMNIQQLTFRGINTTCCYRLSPVPAVTEVCSADNPAPRSLQSKQENQVGMEMSMSPFAWSVCSSAPSWQDALLPPCLRPRIYISTCKLSCQMRMNKY